MSKLTTVEEPRKSKVNLNDPLHLKSVNFEGRPRNISSVSTHKESKNKSHIIIYLLIAHNDATFILTGVEPHNIDHKKVKVNHSGIMMDHVDHKNKSMYARSPFGLSIGRIDQK
jgi:hypothetical protein